MDHGRVVLDPGSVRLRSWRLTPALRGGAPASSGRALYNGALACTLALSLWMYWPTLQHGLFADDYVAMAILDGKFAAPRNRLDVFNFADGTPEDVAALQRLGSIPWWAPSDYRIAFMRPLSSALWHIDRALFGRSYGAYHAHSLFAFFLLVIAASVFYRRIMPAGVAAFATLMFALDDSHHFPVVWLSNRGGIYALFIGVLALLAHLRWREEGRPVYGWLSGALVCIGLLFGEWALSMLAYVLAYELLGASGPLRKRAPALLPSLLPSAVFLISRALLHYGARGSGAYIDPGAEPMRFIEALGERIPLFIADMLWNVPAEWWDHGTPWRDQILGWWMIPPSLWIQLPGWHFFQYTFGLLSMLVLAAAVRFIYPGLSSSERRHVRWLLLGSAGALMPVVGSFLSTRLTISAYFGLAPVFALVLRQIARRLRALGSPRLLNFAACYAVVAIILHVQVFAPLRDDIQAQVDGQAVTTEWALAAELDPAQLEKQRVFLLAGAEFTSTFFFSYIWSSHGRPQPLSYYPITTAPSAQFIERTGPAELRLSSLGGRYLSSGHEEMFHSPDRTWLEGQWQAQPGLSIMAEQVDAGLPRALRLRFERPLEDPSYVFLVAAPYGLVRFYPPPLGVQRLVQRAAHPSWVALDNHRYISRIWPLPEALFYGSVPGFVMYKPRERFMGIRLP